MKDSTVAANLLRKLLGVVAIVKVSADEIQNAFSLAWDDFEDAVQYSAALSAGVDAIITRDRSGFSLAQISVYTPDEFLACIQERMG